MAKTREITALKLQKRNQQRVNVYLDGEFAFGLARAVATWLQVGQQLGAEKIAELQAKDAREVAYQRALNFLSYRLRSEDEVRQNLQKHEVPDEIIEETVERLRESGLVDDAAFVRAWIENRATFRPRGRYALRMELRQKGVPDDLIEDALEEVDEAALAYRAGLKKASKLKSLEFYDFKRKLYGYLNRRGFQYDTITSVVQRIWDEHQQNTNEELK